MKNKNILIELLDLYELEKSQKRLIRDMYTNKSDKIDKEIENDIDNIKVKKKNEIEILSKKISQLKEELQKDINEIKTNKIESFIKDVANFASIDLKVIQQNNNNNEIIDIVNSNLEEEQIKENDSLD